MVIYYGNKKSIGKETILYHHRVIHRILNYAVLEDEILRRNVSDRIDLPEPELHDDNLENDLVKVFTESEIKTLEEAAAGTTYGNLVAVALRTGMRRGELLALTWDCIDTKNHTIFVKRAIVHTKERGYEYKPTKNKKRRRIEISQEVLDALAKEETKQSPFKEKLGENYATDNLIFCQGDGKPMHPDSVSSWFPDFCIEKNIPRLTFHCLRHTHASHLLAAGEDISFVSKRLGHSDISVTYNKYFHLIPMERRESVQNLEKRFK